MSWDVEFIIWCLILLALFFFFNIYATVTYEIVVTIPHDFIAKMWCFFS